MAAAPPPSRLDQATALRLVRQGGFVIVIGLPAASSIGLDLVTYTTGPSFLGYKMVPPGPHLLHWAASDSAVRTSLFVAVEPGGSIVLRWSADRECLEVAAAVDASGQGGDDAEALALAAAARRMELDASLGPYPFDSLAKWRALMSHALPAAVERVLPVGGLIHADAEACFARTLDAALDSRGPTTAKSQRRPSDSAHSMHDEEDVRLLSSSSPAAPSSPATRHSTGLYFSKLAGCGAGSRPAHRTRYAIDTSFTLVQLGRDMLRRGVPEPEIGVAVLGELQLAFVLFLVGQSFVALEQWKRLVDVLCRAEDLMLRRYVVAAGDGRAEGGATEAVATASAKAADAECAAVRLLGRPGFIADAFSIVRSQIAELPADLCGADGSSELSGDNFLMRSLSALSRTAAVASRSEPAAPMQQAAVADEVRRLLAVGRDKLGWVSGGVDAGSGVEAEDGAMQAATMQELLEALAAEGGDDDLPTIV